MIATDKSNAELLGELGIDLTAEPQKTYTAEQERVLFAFGEINDFITTHNRRPEKSADQDIFERIMAVRLQRIQQTTDYNDLLQPADIHNLLSKNTATADNTTDTPEPEHMNDGELLAELGIDPTAEIKNDITNLVHVRENSVINHADTLSQTHPCPDFAKFKPLFDKIQTELDTGTYTTEQVRGRVTPKIGEFYIIRGQKAYIAALKNIDGRNKVRIIYDNSTENTLILESFQRILLPETRKNRDYARKIVLSADLFTTTGYIYVARSLSTNPDIVKYGHTLHKIGVTSGHIKKRLANTTNDPTFLMDAVQSVAEFTLQNIHPQKLENVIHKFFAPARAHITITDRFGKPISPREWFLLPLPPIRQAIHRIQDGTITDYQYDIHTAQIIKSPPPTGESKWT